VLDVNSIELLQDLLSAYSFLVFRLILLAPGGDVHVMSLTDCTFLHLSVTVDMFRDFCEHFQVDRGVNVEKFLRAEVIEVWRVCDMLTDRVVT
jgi:hypothetical protein